MEIQFPPVDWADPETGLLCVGGDLSLETLLAAYRGGIFPWPLGDGDELYWFAPEQRAVLRFSELHVSRSLRRERNRARFEFRIDTDIDQIIKQCSLTRRAAGERTWITPSLADAYMGLWRAGYTKSVATYLRGELVGGVYGVRIGKFFAGESMFYLEPNASKLALWILVEELERLGVSWMDCQQLTPLLKQFGARFESRENFMTMLQQALG